ncbi:MAG TPA: multicopper oxidase domain-containing protein, partial [Gammaproteobacteria bacterium]|nr:multicopper oxidase domain-containing protein [Gammaproteobacteria bacterium]
VAADGQNVEPVEIDEFQIGVAETYDVVVQPTEDRAYTLFAESMDRSGYTRGTLAPREGMTAAVPALRERPLRTMVDMGMDMSRMKMDMPMGDMNMGAMNNEMPGMSPKAESDTGSMMEAAGPIIARHGPDHHGVGNVTVAEVQRNRLGEPGAGLENAGHRVLVYNDLKRLARDFDARPPGRELELHLTGNMERYMWSFDGKKYSEVKGPIEFEHNERLRLILVNDTMMEHPIHLHGMWMELENGHGSSIPRKHTISAKPSERLSVLITPKDKGRWAFHCHLLYHMEMGMFRVVRVS